MTKQELKLIIKEKLYDFAGTLNYDEFKWMAEGIKKELNDYTLSSEGDARNIFDGYIIEKVKDFIRKTTTTKTI